VLSVGSRGSIDGRRDVMNRDERRKPIGDSRAKKGEGHCVLKVGSTGLDILPG